MLNQNWDLSLPIIERLEAANLATANHIFREILIVASWAIWKHRNGIIFDNKAPSLEQWKRELKQEMDLTIIKAKGQNKVDLVCNIFSF